MRNFSYFAFLLLLFVFQTRAQSIRINEVMSSNSGVLTDKDGEAPDWIELHNPTNVSVNLDGYGISDKKTSPFKWTFPNIIVNPNEYLLVFASGKDRKELPVYLNTLIRSGDTWKYLIPTSEPATNWRTSTYNDSSWNTGKSGFGFGDNDDATIVPQCNSVFIRKTFTISNLSSITQLMLHMDYDDGFVAFLNGIEIARVNMAGINNLPSFNTFASDQHEALMYQGQNPEKFDISNPAAILKNGENILAIQIHNANATSSDLSAIPFLTIGTSIKPENQQVATFIPTVRNELHTNFKISASGESIYLTRPNGSLADSVRVPVLPTNYSYGRKKDTPEVWAVFTNSTPEKENLGETYTGEMAGNPTFSLTAGFYSSPVKVKLSAPNPADSIYYTLDGSVPGKHSSRATDEISINSSTVLRARIIKTGMLAGQTVTHSYIIYNNQNLPVVSLSMNPADLWDYYSGIYVKGPNAAAANPNFGANFWQDWEKNCHFEMLENTGQKVVDVDAGVKIYGNWSRAHAQKSMAVYSRKSYGQEYIKYKIFRERPFDNFKNLVMRNSGNDWNVTMFRDGLMTGLTKGCGLDYMAFRPSILFLNGQYWGILNLREKINEHFLASNHGVDPEKVVLLENNASPIIGSETEYLNLYAFIEQNNLSNQANYDKVEAEIDIANFINYFAAEIFFRNHDWPGNNIKYWKTTDAGSKWRWLLFDTDFGMGIWNSSPTENTLALATATNGPTWPNPPWSTLVFRKLLENQGFRNQFVSRFADLLNSSFSVAHVNRAIDEKSGTIAAEIGNHLNRWNGGSISAWYSNVQQMRNFANSRPSNVFNHLRQKFGFDYPQQIVVRTDSLKGHIQLNTLKITQNPWIGSYFKEIPVTLLAVPKAGYRFVKWEGVTTGSSSAKLTINASAGLNITALFESDGSHYENIVINEISYNNNAQEDPGDWIELYNKGQFDVDISSWKITDADPNHQFSFPSGTILRANEYLVVCTDAAKIRTVFGNVKNLLNPHFLTFGLSNSVDAVKLYAQNGQLIDEVNYYNDVPWPVWNLNELWSLELKDPKLDNNAGSNWVVSVNSGTPGVRNTTYIPASAEQMQLSQNEPELRQNYPNPFSTETYFEVILTSEEVCKISILDVNGRIIRTMVGENPSSTKQTFSWDGKDHSGKNVAPGVYFYRLESTGSSQMKRMVKL